VSAPVPSRAVAGSGYGWSGEGKDAAEISSDIDQTRYRLDADIRALREKLAPKRLIPAAAIAAGLAARSVVIRAIRRRKR
jgi:hypothetical protein